MAENSAQFGPSQPREDFFCGQLPEVRQAPLRRRASEPGRCDTPRSRSTRSSGTSRALRLLQFYRQFPLGSGGARGAEFRDRTSSAGRVAGQADGRAELHHGLIEIAGPPSIEQRARPPRQSARRARRRGDLRSVVGQPADHADDIAINRGVRQVERDAGDRRRRVGTHAGKREHFFVCCRDMPGSPSVSGAPRCKIARAAVIAEAAPGREDFVSPARRPAASIEGNSSRKRR